MVCEAISHCGTLPLERIHGNTDDLYYFHVLAKELLLRTEEGLGDV